MPIFFISSNRYFQYRLQLVISKHFHNYTVVTYDNIYTVSQSTILAELQLMNARMILEQENLRREKKIDTKTGISSVSMLL